jgi:hypothetical protein
MWNLPEKLLKLTLDLTGALTTRQACDNANRLLRDPQAQYLVINLKGVEAGEQT